MWLWQIRLESLSGWPGQFIPSVFYRLQTSGKNCGWLNLVFNFEHILGCMFFLSHLQPFHKKT